MAPSAIPIDGNEWLHSEATNGDFSPKTNVEESQPSNMMPIAIVGMGCRLPGDVSSPEEFWELCSRARSGWSPIPKERFNHEAFHHPNPDKLGCYNPEGGHFLKEDLGLFDAPFFNLTEKEAISMDPQQRLLLECTYEALENGGIPKHTLVGKDVGVYVGGSFADYELRNCRDTDTAPMYQATGCASSLLANRLSYYFDLAGPSLTVDTACSSSLTALHMACQSLRMGESSQAIVASCHLNILPDYFITMSMSSLFSNEGKSFAFDHRGSGFGRGEGVGCVILKPLDEALKANDSIRAVIVGSGINQDGRTKGITMPSGDAQVALMKSVYEKSGLNPSDTGYIEAHGTGTKVGDPIEASALHEVFGEGRTAKKPLFIGSVKSNIGHLEGASGVVSVIKTAMMLEKGFILPNCNFEKPNPKIPFDEWNLKVPTNQRPWPPGKKYASINNFGFGGANAHAVLGKAPAVSKVVPRQNIDGPVSTTQGPTKRIYVLSANDKVTLEKQQNDLTIYLEQRPEVFQNSLLPNLAYTLGQRRSVLAWKVAVPAYSSAELIATLAGNIVTPSRSVKAPKIGFIFTGQGAQWHAMGRELLESYPIFNTTMRKIDDCLSKLGAQFSLLDELSTEAEASRVSAAEISQPACTAVQIALVELLKSWNIHPSAVAGHSSGEIAAAYATGALSLEDAVAIAYYRGQSIPQLKSRFPDLKGAMMAVGGSADEINSMLEQMTCKGKVVVGCINSPASITASGDEDAINQLQQLVEEKQLFNRKLRVETAYHSHHMNLVAEQYAESIKTVSSREATQPTLFHSSLLGRQISTSELGPSYWVDNLTSPVRFSEAVQSMCKPADETSPDPGVDVLVELGPHAALEGPIKQILKAVGGRAIKLPYVSALLRNKNAVDTALNLAATLFMKGAPVDFEAINYPIPPTKRPSLLTNLPKYPWNHSRKYWHQARIAEQHENRQFPRNDLLGTLANYSNHLEPIWRNIINADDMPWVRHHKMQDMTVYPMAGYMTMAMEAAAQRAVMRNVAFDKFELREITVSRPLVIAEGSNVEVNVTLRAHAEGTRSSSDSWDEFRVFSWASDRSWIEHCRGLISVQKNTDNNVIDGAQQKLDEKLLLLSEIDTINKASNCNVDTTQMYETLSAAGAGYGKTFQGLENCRASDSHAVADLVIPDTAAVMPMGHETDCIIHPALLDQFIQIVWPIFGAGRKGLDCFYMPSFVESMSVSTGITRKSGDRLKVFGSGRPTPFNPSPTKFSFFATDYDGRNEGLLSVTSLVMTPVLNGDSGSGAVTSRELCYKLEWEPAFSQKDEVDVQENSAASPAATTDAVPDQEIAIVCEEAQQSLVSSLQKLICDFTNKTPVVGSLGKMSTEGKICVVLSELDHPTISAMDKPEFEAIQNMVKGASGILWVVRGAYTESENPNSQMVVGMARSIQSETLLKFATLDLGTSPQLSETESAAKIFQVFQRTFSSTSSSIGLDLEFAERQGKLMVPRVVDDWEMDKFVHQETQDFAPPDLQPFEQEGRPLKLAIGTPGALDTIYFADDLVAGQDLPEYEVEIKVEATSMNFKDIMVSMGQLNQPYIGVECAGIISAVGSRVTGLAIGDRVCAMSEGAYSTYARCLGTSVQKIADDMSFVDASTIPVVYCTAYYSLFDLGRLAKDEKVLIHAAAGGVGQAAILLCQMVGAEIFATVGSVTKKEFLMAEYGLPEDHIFFSRNTSFAKAIRRATKGRGVDVVLNSLAGDQLRETWDSLAHFGRFIEIGKRDIVGNTRLEMARFEYNATFSSVDLTVVAAERPQIMKRLLADVFDLLSTGSIRPVSPITIFPISNVESAFRTLQSGKTMGKVIVVPNPGDQVKAVPRKTPNNLLKSDATYIIIGGTGGLGRSMGRWMIEKGARNIALLSRSASTSGKVGELIEEAKTKNARIVVRSCDVCDREQVNTLLTEGIREMPPVRGIIHAAMVLDDVLFEKMAWEQWDTVVKAKVSGAWNFHYALADRPVDFFICLSSAAGAVGNRGQAAYAAANCFLNAFVQYRNKHGLAASSIDLTAVSDVGYLAENAAKQAQVAENLGSETISEMEVLALIGAAIRGDLQKNCNNHCITGLKIGSKAQDLFWVDDAKFGYLKKAALAKQEEDETALPTVSLASALKASTSKEQALQLVCEGLMTKVSAVLMVPREEMDSSRPIVAYGLDSLVAIEIRNWITRELEASLQVLELLTSSSITGLGDLILKKSKLVNFQTAEPANSG
ncbi:hypothetical protein BP5796_10801 [Coleophoma crateriformis]|uniref:Uncharacterized protein n=1 Tax=Coleophoma crateriformis TaxID=565419 RepID=A0A3D8QL32_9HELO|nr:hypothetical protein BP5796_10801 [Coleophoma crateriformis]